MKRIGILTSGGDASGMNAAIRAAVRTALDKGWEVYGIRRGYTGLINGEMKPLSARDVGGIIQNGGTILGSARCPEFLTEAGRRKALDTLSQRQIEALIVIGGNGSQKGTFTLHQMGYPVVGIASTIDNDLYGFDITIGVDSALWVAIEAIDRLKVTASSHHRAFIIEIMGRNCGYLALMAGIAGGAEVIVVPEVETDPEEVVFGVRYAYQVGKAHCLVVVAEGAEYNAAGLRRYFEQHYPELAANMRVTILGHVQRGGEPTAFDRLLGSRSGAAATDCLARGELGVLVGLRQGEIKTKPLAEVATGKKLLDREMLELARVLAK